MASFIVKDKPAQPMNKVSIQEVSCVDTTTALPIVFRPNGISVCIWLQCSDHQYDIGAKG